MSIITLAEAKEACNVSHTAQDTFLQTVIDGVEDWAQAYLGRDFSSALHVEFVEGGGFALRPDHRPVTSVSEVYDTEAGAIEATADWDLKDDGIYRDAMDRWESDPHNRWRVTYYGGNSLITAIKMAMLMLIARAWANREGLERQGAAGYGSSFAALADTDIVAILQPFRRGKVFFG